MERNYSTIFEEIGFCPVLSYSAQTLFDAAKRSLEILGKSTSKALLYHMCSLYKLNEQELLTNYEFFEKALYDVLGRGANIVLRYLTKEILSHHDIPTIQNGIINKERILEIQRMEIFEFIRRIPVHEHVAFFYRNDDFKDKTLIGFFDGDEINSTQKVLLSEKPTKLKTVMNMTYKELSQYEKDKILKCLSDGVIKLHSRDKVENNNNKTSTGRVATTARIATENTEWWFRNGFGDDHLRFERSLGKKIHDNVSFLCIYNGTDPLINGSSFRTIISSHSFVIVDEPLMVYKAIR